MTAAPPEEAAAGVVLDADRRLVAHGTSSQRLTPLEFGVLEVLLRSPGRVHRYAELTRTVWGVHYTGDTSSLHALNPPSICRTPLGASCLSINACAASCESFPSLHTT